MSTLSIVSKPLLHLDDGEISKVVSLIKKKVLSCTLPPNLDGLKFSIIALLTFLGTTEVLISFFAVTPVHWLDVKVKE